MSAHSPSKLPCRSSSVEGIWWVFKKTRLDLGDVVGKAKNFEQVMELLEQHSKALKNLIKMYVKSWEENEGNIDPSTYYTLISEVQNLQFIIYMLEKDKYIKTKVKTKIYKMLLVAAKVATLGPPEFASADDYDEAMLGLLAEEMVQVWLDKQNNKTAALDRLTQEVSTDINYLFDNLDQGHHHMSVSFGRPVRRFMVCLDKNDEDVSVAADWELISTAVTAGYVSGGTLSITSDTGNVHQDGKTELTVVRSWVLRDGIAVPLSESACFAMHCTDDDTGEPVPPEYGLLYSESFPLPSGSNAS